MDWVGQYTEFAKIFVILQYWITNKYVSINLTTYRPTVKKLTAGSYSDYAM